jgi:hypothetical protein
MVVNNLNELSSTNKKNFLFVDDECKYKFLKKNKNSNFEVWNYKLQNVVFCGENLFYPNVICFSKKSKKTYKIIYEQSMSLEKKQSSDQNYAINLKEITDECEFPVFYFVYNTDNYYHYIYDTLPYLISYLDLKKNIPNLKLLLNYPNISMSNHYKFIEEPIELLGINKQDILIINPNTCYNTVFFSSSFTHSEKNNEKPRPEIYKFYQNLISKVPKIESTPKKIYVSRRVNKESDFSNIGTNYTTRRILMNEKNIVEFLEKKGFIEVFTENLTFVEKVNLFRNAKIVVGSIGGGLCNVLFSSKRTNLYCLVSPYFLDINYRFLYSFKNVKLHLFMDSYNTEVGDFKKNIRVQTKNNIVGEIYEVNENTIKISYLDANVAGWNLQSNFKYLEVEKSECTKLDNGLNSSWEINLDKFKSLIN